MTFAFAWRGARHLALGDIGGGNGRGVDNSFGKLLAYFFSARGRTDGKRALVTAWTYSRCSPYASPSVLEFRLGKPLCRAAAAAFC